MIDFTTAEDKSQIKLLNFKNVVRNLKKLKIVDKVGKTVYEKLLPNFWTYNIIKKKKIQFDNFFLSA